MEAELRRLQARWAGPQRLRPRNAVRVGVDPSRSERRRLRVAPCDLERLRATRVYPGLDTRLGHCESLPALAPILAPSLRVPPSYPSESSVRVTPSPLDSPSESTSRVVPSESSLPSLPSEYPFRVSLPSYPFRLSLPSLPSRPLRPRLVWESTRLGRKGRLLLEPANLFPSPSESLRSTMPIRTMTPSRRRCAREPPGGQRVEFYALGPPGPGSIPPAAPISRNRRPARTIRGPGAGCVSGPGRFPPRTGEGSAGGGMFP